MRLGVAALLGWLAAWPVGAQSLPEVTIEPEIRALLAVKQRMRDSLEEVPELVCSQTVRRMRVNEQQRRRLEKRMAKAIARGRNLRETTLAEFSDVVRLEVAVVDGTELYSWPGAAFEPIRPAELVGFGLMADGALFSFARSVFLTHQATIRFAGEQALEGRPALRFDYQVPYFRSGYTITTVSGSAKVAFRGSFWVDPESFAVLRLDKEGVDLPPELALVAATAHVDYQQVTIDGRELTLPRLAVDELLAMDGAVSRNEATFERCRRFLAGSSLSFDVSEREAEEPAPQPEPTLPALPSGLTLRLRLAEAIEGEKAVVGDAVTAELRRDVLVGGRTLARKGDVIRGRLRRVQRLGGEDAPYYAIALTFDGLTAKLVDVQDTGGISRNEPYRPRVETTRRSNFGFETYGGGFETSASRDAIDLGVDGLDTFYVPGERWALPKGFALTLETRGP
ncbi:MAG: hypothetical protein KDC27_21700 [Acidobacteria bacterium]|nr:hypothetical protein [Acidobacteriota bacterium]